MTTTAAYTQLRDASLAGHANIIKDVNLKVQQGSTSEDVRDLECSAWKVLQLAHLMDSVINDEKIITDDNFYQVVSLINRLTGLKYQDVTDTLNIAVLNFTNDFAGIVTIVIAASSDVAGGTQQIQYNLAGVHAADSQLIRHTVEKALSTGTRTGTVGTNSFISGTNQQASNTNASALAGRNIVVSGVDAMGGGKDVTVSDNYGFGSGEFVIVSGASAFGGGKGLTTKEILASGISSFVYSENTAAQTVSHGALAPGSAILGGRNHNIPVDSSRTVVLGGDAIKADATRSDVVYAPEVVITKGTLDLGQAVLSASGVVNINAIGNDTNIDVLVTVKGTGTVTVPVGYEANIDADVDLINRKYLDDQGFIAAAHALTSHSDVDTTGVATGSLLYKSAGDWVDTGSALLWDGATDLTFVDGGRIVNTGTQWVTATTLLNLEGSASAGRINLLVGSTGLVSLGKSDSLGATRTVQVEGSATNIDLVFIPQGTGTLTVPTGYEANIDADEDLVNRAFVLDQISAAPGGASTNIQFNDASAFGGAATFSIISANASVHIGTRTGATGTNQILVGTNIESSGTDTLLSGSNNKANANQTFATGLRTEAGAVAAFAGGLSDNVARRVLASGTPSFNFSENTASQTAGHGALAADSAILGGRDHNIEAGNIRSVIIGGDAIKLTGSTYVDHVAVANLAIMTLPGVGGADDLLTRDATTGIIGFVTQASITGSGQANTSSNLGGGFTLAASKVGVDLPFKSLVGGSGITLSADTNEVTIDAVGTGALNDLTDVFNSSPADKHVIIYDGISDLRYENRLLLADDITGGTFADARISVTSITQHEASINHDNLAAFVGDEHIDHSTLDIVTAANSGLAGGAALTSDVTLTVDLSNLVTDTSIASGDLIPFRDISPAANSNITFANFEGALTLANQIGGANLWTAGSGFVYRTDAIVVGSSTGNPGVITGHAQSATDDVFDVVNSSGTTVMSMQTLSSHGTFSIWDSTPNARVILDGGGAAEFNMNSHFSIDSTLSGTGYKDFAVRRSGGWELADADLSANSFNASSSVGVIGTSANDRAVAIFSTHATLTDTVMIIGAERTASSAYKVQGWYAGNGSTSSFSNELAYIRGDGKWFWATTPTTGDTSDRILMYDATGEVRSIAGNSYISVNSDSDVISGTTVTFLNGSILRIGTGGQAAEFDEQKLTIKDDVEVVFGSSAGVQCELSYISASIEMAFNMSAEGNIVFQDDTVTEFSFDLSGAGTGDATANDWIGTSDRRLKTNIRPLESYLDRAVMIGKQAVRYEWREEKKAGIENIGLIAQDIESIAPEFVTYNQKQDQYGLRYSKMVTISLKGLSELHDIVKGQGEEILELHNTIESQGKEITRLASLVEQLLEDR